MYLKNHNHVSNPGLSETLSLPEMAIDIVVLWRKSFVVDLVPNQLICEKVNLGDHGWEYVECFNDCSTCNMHLVRMLFILWTCNMSTSIMIELSSFFDDINF